MLGYKTSFNKFKKTETISTILSKHNGIKLTLITIRKLENSPIHGD